MNFTGERINFNERLRDSRLLLSFIREQESTATPPIDVDAVKILRGLFYVNIYGSLERSVNELFSNFLTAIGQLNIGAHHYVHTFLPIAMDGHFSSLGDPFAKKRFTKRIDFSSVLHRNEIIILNSSIFESQLQNTKTSVIVDILKSIGADPEPIRTHSKKLYIDEIAEKRNQVAHGRSSAREVGATGRASDLELRLLAVTDFYESIAQILEEFFNSRGFLMQRS